jgi:UDP-GlcNAc:undecaprenyl-phosphate/decaprenyl-phosphate GlcNAc-1-phosphate transferase
MNTYLLLFIVSTCASFVFTPLMGRISERFGWVDKPRDGRRVHRNPVPRLGGVAIFAAVILALATLPFINNLVTQTLRTDGAQLLRVLAPATLIFLIGVYDDFRGTNAPVKFTAQVLAGLLFCAMGGRIQALSVPLVGSIELHPMFGYALTVLWTVGICNAFNLIDGMDGLGTGASLFAALVMFVVSLMLGHPLVTVVAVVLCGSLVGFLPYNFNPASIFLGDSGSLFIGFTLAALSVQGTQKASTAVAIAIPLIAFGVPVADTGFSIIRRLIGGKPLFQGDREHVHHMLLARGWSQRRVVLALYATCALFGLAALLLVDDSGKQRTGLVLLVVGALIVLAVGRLRYHELDELKASMRRNFADRRLRVANNIRVRRAGRAMSKATTVEEIFIATRDLLELGEFAYATMQLGRNGNGIGNGNGNGHGPQRERKPATVDGSEISKGLVHWTWQRDGVEANEILGSSRFWTLRLPLATESGEWGYLNLYREFGGEALLLEVNYLCEFFQLETAKAVERVLGAAKEEGDKPRFHEAVISAGGNENPQIELRKMGSRI